MRNMFFKYFFTAKLKLKDSSATEAIFVCSPGVLFGTWWVLDLGSTNLGVS